MARLINLTIEILYLLSDFLQAPTLGMVCSRFWGYLEGRHVVIRSVYCESTALSGRIASIDQRINSLRLRIGVLRGRTGRGGFHFFWIG